MKKALLAAIITLAFLLTLVSGKTAVNLAKANPVVVSMHDFRLESPQNKTYFQNSVQISLHYSIPDEPVNNHESMQTSVRYFLDGIEGKGVSTYDVISEKLPSSISYLVRFIITVPNGSHTLSVHVRATPDRGFTNFAVDSETVTFTIDSSYSDINPTPDSTLNVTPNTTPTPTPSPAPTLTPMPSSSLSPSPSSSPSASTSPSASSSPTIQPSASAAFTNQPTSNPGQTADFPVLTAVAFGAAVAVVCVASAVLFLRKRRT